MKKSLLFIFLLVLSISAFGQSLPKGGFYAGLGVNFNLVDYKETETNTLGLSNVNLNGNTIAQGYAGGPYDFPGGTDNIFSSSIQTGYYQLFKNSKWLWGAKLTYSYIGSSLTKGEQHIPQVGAVGNTPFTGDAVVQSFEYQLTNQFTLTPYIGVTAKKAYFYLGAGPSYSQTKEAAYNLVGYAFIGSQEVNISGAPVTFSATDWVFGFSAVVGGAYYFNPSWFLDFSYTFSKTGTQSNTFVQPFSHSEGQINTSGDMIGSTSSHQLLNSFSLTINRVF